MTAEKMDSNRGGITLATQGCLSMCPFLKFMLSFRVIILDMTIHNDIHIQC